MSTYAARTREMFRKYGKVAVGVHFAVYFSGLGGKKGMGRERGSKEKVFATRGALTLVPSLLLFRTLSRSRPPHKHDKNNKKYFNFNNK